MRDELNGTATVDRGSSAKTNQEQVQDGNLAAYNQDNPEIVAELRKRGGEARIDSFKDKTDALFHYPASSPEQRITRVRQILNALNVSVTPDGRNYNLSLNGRSLGRIQDISSDAELANDLESACRAVMTRHLNRVHVVTPTPEGQRWVERQQEVARLSITNDPSGRLLNVARFMSQNSRAALQQFDGRSGDGVSLRLLDPKQEPGYPCMVTTPDGERWYLTESPWYRDQYPNGKPFGQTELILRNVRDSSALVAFPSSTVFNGDSINYQALSRLGSEALSNRRNEIASAAQLNSVDLERLPIGYIGMVDPNVNNDPVISGLATDVASFPEMMNGLRDRDGQARYQFVTADGNASLPVTSAPDQLLSGQVESLYRRGIRTFYINLAGHGNEEGVHFMAAGGHRVLRGSDLTALFDKYPDCNFVVDTLACHGAGLSDDIRDYRDPSGRTGRVMVRLQSKPEANNQEGRILNANGKPEPFSSYYNLYFSHFIRDHSFGEAHRLADLAVKERVGCDAELWCSGPRGGSVAKGL